MKAHLASDIDLAAFLDLRKAVKYVKANTHSPYPIESN